MPDKIARICACAKKLPINLIKNPQRYKNSPTMLLQRERAILELRAKVNKYRAYDSTFSSFIEDIEKEIEDKLLYFQTAGIDKKLVICIDNFHDLNIKNGPRMQDKEKFDFLAQWCADIAKKYDIVVLCTAEFKKLNGNRRPISDDLKESVKIKYEAKAILLAYNDVHYRNDSADIYFTTAGNPHKQPVFELRFAKNKYGSFKGTIYFDFYPEMARMSPCDDRRQELFNTTIYG